MGSTIDNDTYSTLSTYSYDYDGGEPGYHRRHSFAEVCVIMVMLSIFSVIGVTGNALVLYVFSQKRDHQVANHFIIVLAFIDFITCLVVIPWTMYLEYVGLEMSSDWLCKLYQFLISSNVPFSVLVMVAIAIDRYFCICHPFMQALTLIRARIVTGVMALLALSLGVFCACLFGIYVYIDDPVYTELNAVNDSMVASSATPSYEISYVRNLYYVGICQPSNTIFNYSVHMKYQKFHTAVYLICLVVIIVLYSLIYRLVRKRRARRLEQQSMRLMPANQDSTMSGSPITDCVTLNGDSKPCNGKLDIEKKSHGDSIKSNHSNGSDNGGGGSQKDNKKTWSSANTRDSRRERMRIANLKTAAMLFVVTVVFIITYMPAFIMTMIGKVKIIPFYFYFANNVANPAIYSFMNKNFREDLIKIFKKRY